MAGIKNFLQVNAQPGVGPHTLWEVTFKTENKTVTSSGAEFIHLKARQNDYENADRPSRHLAMKLTQTEHLSSIDVIRNSKKVNFISIPPKLNHTCTTFYSNLYTPQSFLVIRAASPGHQAKY